jgi:hypothetical protein
VLVLAFALSETTAPQAEFFAWVFAVRSAVSPDGSNLSAQLVDRCLDTR